MKSPCNSLWSVCHLTTALVFPGHYRTLLVVEGSVGFPTMVKNALRRLVVI